MHRPSFHRAVLLSILSVMLLIMTSCGDFQDSASGSVYEPATGTRTEQTLLTNPSHSQGLPEPAIPNNPAPLTTLPNSVPSNNPPQPTDTNQFPLQSVDTSSPGQSTNPMPSDGPFVPPSAPQQNQTATVGEANMPPWLSPDGPQTKSVTFSWDPPMTHDVAGYKLSIKAMSNAMQYSFDSGLQNTITVTLLLGDQYLASVVAYNSGGDSPPAVITFNLF